MGIIRGGVVGVIWSRFCWALPFGIGVPLFFAGIGLTLAYLLYRLIADPVSDYRNAKNEREQKRRKEYKRYLAQE